MMCEKIELTSFSKQCLLPENDLEKINVMVNNAIQQVTVKKILIKKYNLTPAESDVTIMLVYDLLNWKCIASELNMNYNHLTTIIKKSIYEKLNVNSELGIAMKINKIFDIGQKYD